MTLNNSSFNYVNNNLSSSHQLPDTRKGILELSTIKTTDSHHDTKWQYAGNREDFYNSFASDTTHDQEYSDEEKQLVRKIDWFVMPIICTLDFLQVNKISKPIAHQH